jgi:hypothetical protein
MKKEELRPVEALYIISKEKGLSPTNEENLSAIISYLIEYYMIGGAIGGFGLSAIKGKLFNMNKDNLRDYEKAIIEGIENNNSSKIISSLKNLNIEKSLLNLGYKKEDFYENKKRYKKSSKYKEEIKRLGALEKKLKNTEDIERPKSIIYAFPNLTYKTKTVEIAKKILSKK